MKNKNNIILGVIGIIVIVAVAIVSPKLTSDNKKSIDSNDNSDQAIFARATSEASKIKDEEKKSFKDIDVDTFVILLNNESKVFENYDNTDKVAVHLSRIFYYINANKELLDETTISKFERVFNSLFWLLFIKEDNIQTDIAFKIYQQLLYWSFRNCDLWVVRLLKRLYSSWSHTFTNYKLANVLFSEISFVLFYYYQYENLILENKKQEIKKFIDSQEMYSSTEFGLSWKDLFKEHLAKYSLTYSELNDFIDAEQFEYMLINHCKCCLFSNRSIADWWIKCLFASSNLYHYNLDFLDSLTDNRDALSYYLDSLFEDNSDQIKINKSFNEFNDFFDLEDRQFEHINIYKEKIQKLYNFKNTIKKQREQDYISKSNVNKDLNDLEKHLKDETVKYLKEIGFNDENIDLSDVQARGFYNLVEMFELENSKPLYFDMIKNCFEHDFDEFFEKEMSNNIITFNDSLTEKDIKKCLQITPTFTTEKTMFALERKSNLDSDLIKQLVKLDEEIETLKNNPLLPSYCYGNDKSIKFNYEIHTFELRPLPDEEILKVMDDYKSDNGTYFYQGIQYSYNELFDVLKQKLFTMKIYLKYKIIYDKNNLCVFDPWGFYERKKKKRMINKNR